jgi:hypothetical protein
MKIKTRDGETVGEVITNHSMDIYTACDFAGIDAGHTDDYEYDIDELVMDYDDD